MKGQKKLTAYFSARTTNSEFDPHGSDRSSGNNAIEKQLIVDSNVSLGSTKKPKQIKVHGQEQDGSLDFSRNSSPPKEKAAARVFNFQPEWLQKFKWIERSGSGEVLCKICREAKAHNLFLDPMKLQESFVSTGFSNWKKGSERLPAHEASVQHLFAVAKVNARKSTSIVAVISNAKLKSQEKSCVALKALFSAIVFLAKQGLPFLGHEFENGNFYQLLILRQDEIPELKHWLNRYRSFTSPTILNEMLRIVSHAILRKHIEQVKANRYFSLIIDETTDLSGKEQVSICIRSVSDSLEVKEEFMGLYETESTTADALLALIMDSIKRFGLDLRNLRGQCYDGAANMSGKYNGVAAKLLQKEPKGLFVHCYGHCLNLVVQDVIKGNRLLRDCLSHVHEIGVMLHGSAKRTAVFEAVRRDFEENEETSVLKPQPLCATRWTVRARNVIATLRNYAVIMRFLKTLGKSNDKAASKAYGLYTQLCKSETYYGLLILELILLPTEGLSKLIQTKTATVSGIVKAAALTIEYLQNRKLEFSSVWEKAMKKSEEWDLELPRLPRPRKAPKRYENSTPKSPRSIEEKYEEILQDGIDSVVAEMRRRFDQEGVRTLQEFEEILLQWKNLRDEDRSSRLNQVAARYGFDAARLETQMKMVHDIKPCADISSVASFLSWFKELEPGVQDILSEVKHYLKILMVVPISSATSERSFSVLRRIKDYLRSTMAQVRLNYCCMIHCYSEIASKLDLEELMKEFINNEYRLSVFGKM